MKPNHHILMVILILVLSACSREYPCSIPTLTPQFIGFAVAELDTVIIKKYPKDGDRNTAIDSVVWVPGQNAQANVTNDSIVIYSTPINYFIQPDFDWQIVLPSVSQQYWIDQINYTPRTISCGYGIFSMDKFGCNCVSPLVSARLNNQLVLFDENAAAGRFLNISR